MKSRNSIRTRFPLRLLGTCTAQWKRGKCQHIVALQNQATHSYTLDSKLHMSKITK